MSQPLRSDVPELPLWLRFFQRIVNEVRPSIRDFLVAIVSGLAALGLKAFDEQVSLAFSWANLKNLLFPAVVAGTVFLTFDVVRAARHLAREVKAEAEQEINLYPSLILTEKFVERRVPSSYRVKIVGMTTSLIMVFLLACFASWSFGNQPKVAMSQLTATPDTLAPTPYILTRLVIDSVDKDDVRFHLQVDNGDFPIQDIRAAYSTSNFNVDPDIVGEGFFEVTTFMPRMLPPRGTLSIAGTAMIFTRDKQTSLSVMIGYRAQTGATTSKEFTAIYRFLVKPQDIKPQIIHPEGVETKEEKFNDEAMQSRLTSQSFLLTKGTISFSVEETRPNGEPNIVCDKNEYRSFIFDPVARLVTFQMKTSSGTIVSLELPLPQRNDKWHKIALAWDYSKGGYLVVDGVFTQNFNGHARSSTTPASTPNRESL